MSEQSYATHRKWVPGYHFVLFLMTVVTWGGSVYNLYRAWGRGDGRGDAILLLFLASCMAMAVFYLRIFPLKAQDRAICAEENLRHYLLYGEPLPAELNVRQIVGLRFASNREFGPLAKRAIAERLSENAIKKAIKDWRADTYRV
jgi:hypothetical protein